MSYLSSHAAGNDRAATVLKAIDEWNAGLDSDDRRAKYEKMAESALLINEKKLESSKASLKRLEAELLDCKIDLEHTTVYARKNGSVCNMYLSKGTYVEPGEPLFAFIETDRWWVQANIKETMLRNVRPGQRATVVLSI